MRTYGKVLCDIWNDNTFLNLSHDASRLYFRFITGSDISAAGVLPLTERRWHSAFQDNPAERIAAALDELALTEINEHGFGLIVVDENTAEVWVRGFIGVDGRATADNSKMRKSVENALSDVISPMLRTAIERQYPGIMPVDNQTQIEHISAIERRSNVDKSKPDRRSNGDRSEPDRNGSTASSKQQAANHQPEPANRKPRLRHKVNVPPGDELPPAAAAAIEIFINHRVRMKDPRSPEGFRRTLREQIPDEWHDRLADYCDAVPDADALELARNVFLIGPADLANVLAASKEAV